MIKLVIKFCEETCEMTTFKNDKLGPTHSYKVGAETFSDITLPKRQLILLKMIVIGEK